MFDGRSLAEAERLIDEWRGTIEERAVRARHLSSRLATLTETVRSPDGLITVTVGPGGELAGLVLGEGIRHRSAAGTAGEIMATLRLARAAMITAVAAVTEQTVGADSATGRAVIEGYAARLSPEDGCRD